MILPKALKRGSTIRIVSPAGKLKEERVLPAVKWLEKKGFRVIFGRHVFSEYYQFAGTDAQRAQDLQEALDDPQTDAILCSRGGYGVVRIIDRLDFTSFKKNPKWIVGYSDITVLHLCMNRLGYSSIHATMPPFFLQADGSETENLQTLMQTISGNPVSYGVPLNRYNRNGYAGGELIGGNLSVITSLLGTKYEIETDGKILFLEETDEYLYHIDRMVYQLKLAGKLDRLAGLVVGDFTGIKDNESPFGQNVEEIILELVKKYNFPVCFGFKAGHDKINLALKLGAKWELALDEAKATLKMV